MDSDRRPTWLTEPCPPWCVRVHQEDDHPEDRRHQGDPQQIALVVAISEVAGRDTAALELAVRLDQPVGTGSVWVRVEATEAAEPRLMLAPASAEFLANSLTAAVATHGDATS